MAGVNLDTWAAGIVDACWIIFAAVWIVAAFATKRAVYKQSLTQRFAWTVVTAAGALLIFGRLDPFDVLLLPPDLTKAVLSAFLCMCGLAFALWARVTIGSNWSGRVTLKEDHELIQRGPYRLVRHPIYSGLTLMLVATALLLGRAGAFAGVVLIFAGFWIKMAQEEQLMMRTFPERYADYRRRVKRIIPLVF